MRTVTLGPVGSYSYRAASAVSDTIEFCETNPDVVALVAAGDYERGVVPVENSIGGSVSETLDALAEHEVAVVGEIVTPIVHALIAQGEGFDTVASHEQALAQCRGYLNDHYPDAAREAVSSTTAGVERAAEDASVAAIAHPDNAGEGLSVLAEGIQDKDSNATRFLVVAPVAERSESGGKTSLVVYPNADYPGLLLSLLEPFAERDINLTRVESRPSGERLGDYVFHVDIEAGLYEQRTKDAVAELEDLAADGWVKRLGSYDIRHVA
jgi:prephenate dehydratase